MSSPTKEDLPKIADTLKNELECEHHLKHADTEEKIVLPSEAEIKQEKEHQELLKGIETFACENLNHADTQEKNPLPTKETIDLEKASV